MSIVQRQIVWGVSASLVFLLFLSGSYMFVFPPKDWIQLWDKELMGIPFLLFVTTAAIAIGVLFGVATGYSWKKQIDALETSIDHFDGNSKEIHTVSHFFRRNKWFGQKNKTSTNAINGANKIITAAC